VVRKLGLKAATMHDRHVTFSKEKTHISQKAKARKPTQRRAHVIFIEDAVRPFVKKSWLNRIFFRLHNNVV
jgi:2-C-methyl-D-erythritol 4-phosphate cytidylyltransferase